MSAKKYFTQQQLDDIKLCVQNAELDTSGEIRLYIEEVCKVEVLDRAAYLFNKLGMTKTKLRNGVLIYLAVRDHKFAIIGDAGINAKVPADFWDKTKDIMLNDFKNGFFTEGLCKGVQLAGEHLKQHFPFHSDDVNELPDDITFQN